MLLLDSLLDPAGGWTVTDARAINALGQIAGSACKDGLCYAVRLDLAPIPEPGQQAMFAAGIVVLLRGRLARSARHWRLPRTLQLRVPGRKVHATHA